MIKTIKDLIEYYNINTTTPDYVLEYEFPEEIENYGTYHKETHNGKTIHVFTTEEEVDGDTIKIENILDLNPPESWTEIMKSTKTGQSTYNTITFSEEYVMETKD